MRMAPESLPRPGPLRRRAGPPASLRQKETAAPEQAEVDRAECVQQRCVGAA